MILILTQSVENFLRRGRTDGLAKENMGFQAEFKLHELIFVKLSVFQFLNPSVRSLREKFSTDRENVMDTVYWREIKSQDD